MRYNCRQVNPHLISSHLISSHLISSHCSVTNLDEDMTTKTTTSRNTITSKIAKERESDKCLLCGGLLGLRLRNLEASASALS
eukprot:scaffold15107_cov576-Ochromonas_danica.AAC.1